MTRITNRRHHLVAYDISDDTRRNGIFKTLKDFGNHIQYSVFLCELDRSELVQLRERLRDFIDASTDQVMFLDLGPAVHEIGDQLDVIGQPYSPPGRRFVV